MAGSYFLGIDIGTTGCRAIIFDEKGSIAGAASEEYPILRPKPGWAEQDPKQIYEVVCNVIKKSVTSSKINSNKIAGIGLSSVFHSLICLDGRGEPISNSIIWADTRSVKQAEYLKAYGEFDIYRRTGCRVHPMYPLAKILWFKQENPEVYRKTAKFVSIKEYIIYKWFSEFIIDKSVASGTGIFNIHSLDWDDECIDMIGISRDKLSELVPVTHIIGKLKGEIARELGIVEGIPVVIGAADGAFSMLGSGAYRKGQMAVMIATSGGVRVTSEKPIIDEKGRTWCYVLADGKWMVGGAINNAGLVYRWFRDAFGSEEVRRAEEMGIDPYEILNEYAGRVNPGSDGLIFLPFLTGERSPFWNPNARGVIFGLGPHHGKAHFARAIMEGVAYRMKSVFQAIREIAGEPEEIRITGGGTRSSLWCQILSDVFNRPLKLPKVHEATCLGAAVMAMQGLGYVDSLDIVEEMISIEKEFNPDENTALIYSRVYDLYMNIYWALKPYFDEISAFQQQQYRKED